MGAGSGVEYYARLVEQAKGDPEIVRLSNEQVLAMQNWTPQKMPDIR